MALTAIRRTVIRVPADGVPLVASPALLVVVPLLSLGVRNGDMLGAVWLPLPVPVPAPLILVLMATVDGLTAELESVDLLVADAAPCTAADVALETIAVFEVDVE